jgi:hypothetical protein
MRAIRATMSRAILGALWVRVGGVSGRVVWCCGSGYAWSAGQLVCYDLVTIGVGCCCLFVCVYIIIL